MTHFNSLGTRLNSILDTKLSRRAVLTRTLVSAAALPVGWSLLAACDDADPDEAFSPETDDASDDGDLATDSDDETDDADGEPRRGGTLRIGIPGAVDTLDPHHPVQFTGIWTQSMLFSRLLRLDHELEMIPDLATDWEVNDDASEWTFRLRDDVVFHNGREFTGEDVKASLERLIDPDEGAVAAGEVTMLDHIEVVDDYEVVAHLNAPYADFANLCGMYFMRVVDIENADSLATDPVGTGPYRLQAHSVGERLVMERFEDYYNLDEEAFVDTIEWITISEDTARITALNGGTIDLISEIAPATLPMVQDQPGITVGQSESGNYGPICMRVDEPPLEDVRVRQAFKLILDREAHLTAVLQGQGTLAADHPVPPIDPMVADIPVPEQDIERAQELLSEAGYPDGFEIDLHTTTGRVGMQEAALSFQDMAHEAGIEVEVVNHPNDAFWAEIYRERPFFVSNWSARPVADQALTVGYTRDSGWNETDWYSEEMEDLLAQARAETDEYARHELLSEAQQILAEDGASIIPYFLTISGAWRERVHGFEMHPLKWVDAQLVWVDEEEE